MCGLLLTPVFNHIEMVIYQWDNTTVQRVCYTVIVVSQQCSFSTPNWPFWTSCIDFRAPRRNFPDQRSPSTTYGFWSVLSAKIEKSSMLVDMVGGVAAAPVSPLRFGRCLRCVVKVFGEISDVLPSDAHRIARFRWWI